jgi:hypothetical protein
MPEPRKLDRLVSTQSRRDKDSWSSCGPAILGEATLVGPNKGFDQRELEMPAKMPPNALLVLRNLELDSRLWKHGRVSRAQIRSILYLRRRSKGNLRFGAPSWAQRSMQSCAIRTEQ